VLATPGTHTPSSDIDLALYYQPEAPLAIETLRAIAEKVDDRHRHEAVTEIGGWGPGLMAVDGSPFNARSLVLECQSCTKRDEHNACDSLQDFT
jgi:predicted nucleotidyltransferase